MASIFLSSISLVPAFLVASDIILADSLSPSALMMVVCLSCSAFAITNFDLSTSCCATCFYSSPETCGRPGARGRGGLGWPSGGPRCRRWSADVEDERLLEPWDEEMGAFADGFIKNSMDAVG
nr:hypothetical protein CFP56_28908 [Quercus suber]